MTSSAQNSKAVLLGVITAPRADASDGLRILGVLDDSPAKRAGVLVDDILEKIDKTKVKSPHELDAVLQRYAVEDAVDLHLERNGARLQLRAQLMSQMPAQGGILRGRSRGTTGFKSPGWYAFAWSNIAEGQEPPTPANAEGKVVVIHCFQSW